jgi:predicted TIM-barrel fold metal-dependent hydrolase
MKTYWGEISVSDAHVHFFSHGLFHSLAAHRSAANPNDAVQEVVRLLGWDAPPVQPEELARIWAAELDRRKVARAALIASVPGDEGSVAAAVSSFPDRFYGYFMVNPLAADSLDRVQSALAAGLQGICLFPAMHRYPIGDPRVERILAAASSHSGVVIFVHCGVLTVGIRRKLGLPSPFDMRYSNPIDLHPVALLHPELNFVVPHFGAGYFREALMLCDLCPNVYLDTSSSNSWTRYHSPELDLKSVFRRALDVAGAERLLFGTDSSFFPRGWHQQVFTSQSQVLVDLGIGADEARAILGGNLDRLLRRSSSGIF